MLMCFVFDLLAPCFDPEIEAFMGAYVVKGFLHAMLQFKSNIACKGSRGGPCS